MKPEIIGSISGQHTEQTREWYSTYRSQERRAGIAAVSDLVAAHRAAGAALGGSDIEDDDSDLSGVEESASELRLVGGWVPASARPDLAMAPGVDALEYRRVERAEYRDDVPGTIVATFPPALVQRGTAARL